MTQRPITSDCFMTLRSKESTRDLDFTCTVYLEHYLQDKTATSNEIHDTIKLFSSVNYD